MMKTVKPIKMMRVRWSMMCRPTHTDSMMTCAAVKKIEKPIKTKLWGMSFYIAEKFLKTAGAP